MPAYSYLRRAPAGGWVEFVEPEAMKSRWPMIVNLLIILSLLLCLASAVFSAGIAGAQWAWMKGETGFSIYLGDWVGWSAYPQWPYRDPLPNWTVAQHSTGKGFGGEVPAEVVAFFAAALPGLWLLDRIRSLHRRSG